MSKKKRALSVKQAQSCENALKPRCRCRCGGALHGAKRFGDELPDITDFNSLDEDDPHHIRKKKRLPKQLELPLS